MSVSKPANQKTFSIIMATYNCGQKVENTLRSVLAQDKELFELIVMDGASTDGTLEFIKKYENDLTLVSEKDGGVYDAFNKAIDIATGKYLYFIGAGDYLQPNVLEEVREVLPVSTPALVYGNCYFTKQKIFNGRELNSFDFTWTNICHQGEFYHRSIFDVVGKFDLRYKVFADWLLNLKCFLHKGITKRYIPLHIADYEEGGLSSSIDNDPAFKEDFPRFVRKKLGIKAFVVCQTKMRYPNSLYFTHGLGHFFRNEILVYLVPVARPFVRGYRSLKKTNTDSK